MTVPYTFANQTGTIPLAELDANFAAVPDAANVAGTVTSNAQPNITSVGTLTSLSVTGTTSTNLILQRAPIISLGANAGFSPNIDFIAIGNSAGGNNNQQSYAIAIGSQAGFENQGINAISIGGTAGVLNQGDESVAIGFNAARYNQGGNSVAIGRNAGNVSQGANAVSIGRNSGNISQGIESVAIGHSAGNTAQGAYAVAIGAFAGNINQGANSVALGSFAGYPSVANNAIVINGDTVPLDAPNSGLYIAPLRNITTSNAIFYNNTTKEITYSTAYSNANVASYLPIYSGNLTGLNTISATGNIKGNYFLGNGSLLTGISAGNIVGGYSNANVASYLPTFSGNLTAGNISATGNITGSYILGNGAFLTGVSGSGTYSNSNVALYLEVLTSDISTTGNVTASNFVGGGNSTPAVSSSTNLDLSSPLSVRVLGGGTLRLPSLTTANIANLTPVNGDIIYNSSINKFQGYENGAWGNLI
jgi:hypothetical protein